MSKVIDGADLVVALSRIDTPPNPGGFGSGVGVRRVITALCAAIRP